MSNPREYYGEMNSGANRKLNCWEFKKCGREIGGDNAFELGVCPAATDVMLYGVNNGVNAGRACWVINGTMCYGSVEGTFAQKFKGCAQCQFYAYVKAGEGENFVPTVALLKMLD